MTKKAVKDPAWADDLQALYQVGFEGKEDLLMLLRTPQGKALSPIAIELFTEDSHGPAVEQIAELNYFVEGWRSDISEEWVVFILLDIALHYAKRAPTALEATYPFMRALALASEDVKENKLHRDEHWVLETGNGWCRPFGPPREPVPSWLHSGVIKEAENNYRKGAKTDAPIPNADRRKPLIARSLRQWELERPPKLTKRQRKNRRELEARSEAGKQNTDRLTAKSHGAGSDLDEGGDVSLGSRGDANDE